jgi:hypothetical protein
MFDLRRTEMIDERCACGWTTQFAPGFLQRRYRLPSDMLIFDLQFRIRCSHCRGRDNFLIQVIDTRNHTAQADIPRKVIVS